MKQIRQKGNRQVPVKQIRHNRKQTGSSETDVTGKKQTGFTETATTDRKGRADRRLKGVAESSK